MGPVLEGGIFCGSKAIKKIASRSICQHTCFDGYQQGRRPVTQGFNWHHPRLTLFAPPKWRSSCSQKRLFKTQEPYSPFELQIMQLWAIRINCCLITWQILQSWISKPSIHQFIIRLLKYILMYPRLGPPMGQGNKLLAYLRASSDYLLGSVCPLHSISMIFPLFVLDEVWLGVKLQVTYIIKLRDAFGHLKHHLDKLHTSISSTVPVILRPPLIKEVRDCTCHCCAQLCSVAPFCIPNSWYLSHLIENMCPPVPHSSEISLIFKRGWYQDLDAMERISTDDLANKMKTYYINFVNDLNPGSECMILLTQREWFLGG